MKAVVVCATKITMGSDVVKVMSQLEHIKRMACKLAHETRFATTRFYSDKYGWMSLNLRTLYTWLHGCAKKIHARDLESKIASNDLMYGHGASKLVTTIECWQIIVWANAMLSGLDMYPVRNADGSPQYNPDKMYWMY